MLPMVARKSPFQQLIRVYHTQLLSRVGGKYLVTSTKREKVGAFPLNFLAETLNFHDIIAAPNLMYFT